MKQRLGKNPAMMTVELGVSLVLIVVVLFVVIGLFNDNIKSMIGSSNFARLFSANGLKTFFQSFNRNYDDSQIYVQIMGEQGLEMLRKKANNNDLNLINSAKAAGSDATNSRTANTILYLAQVINVIVGNQEICDTIVNYPDTSGKNASATCTTLSLGVKYRITASGTILTITDDSGNAVQLTISKQAHLSSINSSATAKEKLAAIQQLAQEYGANIDSSYALTKEISNFTTALSAASSETNIEKELINLLGTANFPGSESLRAQLDAAKIACTPPPGSLIRPDGCEPNVSQADLDAYDALVAQIMTQLRTLLNATTSSKKDLVSLPKTELPPAYKPTINADDSWYSANAAAADIIEGSEDALILTKNDPLSLLAPKGEAPILQGSSDAILACADGDNACSECQSGGGRWTTSGCDCSYMGSGYEWTGSSCQYMDPGETGGGSTVCPADSLPYTKVGHATICVVCPDGQLDSTGKCCASGAINLSGACCASGYLDQVGNCGTAPTVTKTCTMSGTTINCPQDDSTLTVNNSTITNPVSVTYTSVISPTGTGTDKIDVKFDVGFITGNKYLNDYYLSTLTGNDDSTVATRIKIKTIENDLMRLVLYKTYNTWTVGKILGQDQRKNSTACSKYSSEMKRISLKYGLTSFYEDLSKIDLATLCP